MSSALLKSVTFQLDWTWSLCKHSFDSKHFFLLFQIGSESKIVLRGGFLFPDWLFLVNKVKVDKKLAKTEIFHCKQVLRAFQHLNILDIWTLILENYIDFQI